MPRITTKEGKTVDVSPETAGHMVQHGYAVMADDKPSKKASADDDTADEAPKRSSRKK